MPNLTEEDLAKIYPNPKTYDELQAEREERQQARRPKFVAAKIALCTSLSLPTVAVISYAALRVARTTNTSSSMTVLAGVCFFILLILVGAVILFYLRSLIDGIASKTIVATSLLWVILLAILLVFGGIGVVLYFYGLHLVLATLLAMGLVFAASFMVMSLFGKHE